MTHPSDQATLHPTYGLQTAVTPTERGGFIPQYRTPQSTRTSVTAQQLDDLEVLLIMGAP